jgi:hypothetical protein
MEKFPEVPIRLEQARPITTLHSLLRLQNETLEQWREKEHTEHLPELQNDIGKDHVILLTHPKRSRALIEDESEVWMQGFGLSDLRFKPFFIARLLLGRSHQPLGRLKVDLIT